MVEAEATGELATAPALRELIEQLRSGDARALGRAISAVENRTAGAEALLAALFPYTGHAVTIGVTGAPGAGKSTLVDRLAREYRRQQKTVGIIAVDPTSPYSGGAFLGDRIRMQAHAGDLGVYIRSMATRGALGGLARTSADVRLVMDAAGRDVILIETVGVGQDEVDVVRVADVNLVVLVPGMGDDMQSLKAGLMEAADVFVINKADRDGAERVERELRVLQSLRPRPDRWTPVMVKTVATEGKGTAELVAAIGDYLQYLAAHDLLQKKREEYWRLRLVEMLRDELLERLLARPGIESELTRNAAEIAQRRRDPYSLVGRMLREF